MRPRPSLPVSRENLRKILQYLFGIAALLFVVRTIEWESLLETMGSISTRSLLIVCLLSLAGVIAQFVTWHALASHRHQYPLVRIAQVDLVIRFVNSLLPSRVSGRSVAPLVIRQYLGSSYADSTAIAMANTGLYALCYGIVTFLGIIIGWKLFPAGLVGLLVLSGCLYTGVGVLIVLSGIAPDQLLRVIGVVRLPCEAVPVVGSRLSGLFDSIIGFAREAAEASHELLSTPKPVVGFVAGWLGSTVVFPSIRFWVLLTAFGVQFEPLVLLPLYLVMAYSVTVLPITPAGLGITEATAAAVFVFLGFPREAVVAAVLIDRVVGVYIPALAGWYPLMRADLSLSRSNKEKDL